jgi:hypothetical protein
LYLWKGEKKLPADQQQKGGCTVGTKKKEEKNRFRTNTEASMSVQHTSGCVGDQFFDRKPTFRSRDGTTYEYSASWTESVKPMLPSQAAIISEWCLA